MSYLNTTSFSTDFADMLNSNGFLQERLPGDVLKLPNSINDIIIKPNEFVLDTTINRCLDRLHQNWLYLSSSSVLPTNNIPDVEFAEKMIIDKGLGLQWADQDDFNFSAFDNDLKGVKNVLKMQNNIDSNVYNMVAATSTNIILLSGTDTQIDVIVNPTSLSGPIRSDSSITHPSNNIFFKSIIDIDINDNKDLFVLDDSHNIIFKFDLAGLVSLDDAILLNDTPGRLLTDTVGGVGELSDKTKFLNPVAITVVENLVYVVDSSTTTNDVMIKVFDTRLNWKRSISVNITEGANVVDINYNESTKNFYLLNHRSGEMVNLITLDGDLNLISTEPLLDPVKHNSDLLSETFKRLYFSSENTNIMYILSNKGVYKKYLSRPIDFIGSFQFNDPVTGSIGPVDSDRELHDLVIFPSETTIDDTYIFKDEILLLEGNRSGIYQFFEDSGFENSIEFNIEEKYIQLQDIKIKADEGVDVITYNKCVSKVLFNNLLLLENTSRRFSTAYNSSGFSIYMGYKYLTTTELDTLKYQIRADNFIGMNEIVLSSTINRCLSMIHELQQRILLVMSEKSLNTYPLPTMAVILE